MADIKYLEDAVAKATEKVEKCKATIARHKAILTKKEKILADKRGAHEPSDLWEVDYKKEDIKGAERKLKDAEAVLAGWKAKLNVALEAERFLEGNAPEVIKIFLENWMEDAFEWHVRMFENYKKFLRETRIAQRNARLEVIKANPEIYAHYLDDNGELKSYYTNDHDLLNVYPDTLIEERLKEKKLDFKTIRKKDLAFGSDIKRMYSYYDDEKAYDWLMEELEKEKKAKMLDLVYRLKDAVGTITDASGLRLVGGLINGIIIGENGKAKIETIGAGGWNIQCWHFRTLVHKIKE